LKLKQFVAVPTSRSFLIPLYEKFIVAWEKKMNAVSLVQYCIVTARQYPDPKSAIKFLEQISLKVENDKDALVLATMESAHFMLVLNDLAGMFCRDSAKDYI
jgi:26S proteasome regulatory subunit N9